ncbi:MAG: peptidoglycan DD-metalloendopeptidase family protein [Bacteroidales bacterium]
MPNHLLKYLLLFTAIFLTLNNSGAFSKKKPVPVSYPVSTSELLSSAAPRFNPYKYLTIYKITDKKNITPIYDYLRSIDYTQPEEYDIWSDSRINPYQVNLTDMKDTVKIDLSGYVPPSAKHVTSDFGFRKWRHHYGIDLKVHRGDTVWNAFDGVVRITKRARDYGNYVVIRHFNGLETLYAHLNKITVNTGDTLKAGNPVGMGGNTGRSTGYHLHFEIRYLGNPVNPNDLINFQDHTVKNSILLLNSKHFEYKKEIDKIRFWTVRSGDSLSRISYRTGIPIAKLCSLNGIKRNSILRIGQRIRYT